MKVGPTEVANEQVARVAVQLKRILVRYALGVLRWCRGRPWWWCCCRLRRRAANERVDRGERADIIGAELRLLAAGSAYYRRGLARGGSGRDEAGEARKTKRVPTAQ